MPPNGSATGLQITNPLVLYRSLLATQRIAPDPGQHRLAIHLQKLYEQLKDYEPTIEYGDRLKQISKATNTQDATSGSEDVAGIGRRGVWTSLLAQKDKRDSLALTRSLTSHESALQMSSPKGLMVHGEVGTGKSMLIDLFADCLPNRKKRRWHFNTFMLEAISKLEYLRRSRLATRSIPPSVDDHDHSLLWLARDMIQTSPILFLDEFQLPDRAASKIMSNLMTSFFHLGGVLIATSNRMPDELAKAAGIEFGSAAPRKDSLFSLFGSRAATRVANRNSGSKGEFAAFLEVLKARCEVWEMDGGRDYRRIEYQQQAPRESEKGDTGTPVAIPVFAGAPVVEAHFGEANVSSTSLPTNYFVKPRDTQDSSALEEWSRAYSTALQRASAGAAEQGWQSSTVRVYGRSVPVPRQHDGVSSWTFAELCASHLGPADYITLASTFHTLILTDVPALTLLQKNEARRFITLLDALYEARCKLFISADAGPDDIFFPETRGSKDLATGSSEAEGGVYAETFSEAYQDVTNPFRPNISSYSSDSSGPDLTHARLAETLSPDALEDDPPNRVRRTFGGGRSFIEDADDEGRVALEQEQARIKRGPNFGQTSMYTGEDERFAYKRARSRLWEMCGTKWWDRNEEGWWRPLPKEVRRWEISQEELQQQQELLRSSVSTPTDTGTLPLGVGEGLGGQADIDEKKDEVLFRHGASPFRTAQEPPPKISWTHVWGTMKWGKKAGAWGKGVEGLSERKKDKE